ncbi:MAG: L-histidine N(alpha)-methyltransferase [Solirubrobacterales bacterium]|nr:L-histidine N(alpha)-methyltransferase [Solirubrobacterales bacterium]
MEPAGTLSRVFVHNYLEEAADSSLADDVLDGLTRPFKELPPKHFYDEVGADLFDQVCDEPEYYPTRTERAILQERAAEIVELTGAAELVELGSGTAAKTRILLQAMADAGTLQRYVPFDVTEGMVRDVAAELTQEHPELTVHGIVGDFERHLEHIPAPDGPRIVAFLGGTLGNFIPGSRRRFLRQLADVLRPQDYLLLGTDLVKDPAIIEAAYNDAAGISAAFNRNVLHVINRELDADFEPDAFEHFAFFDREREWIEMRLRASRKMTVNVRALNLVIDFAPREEMRTEISTKFTPERLAEDLEASGLELAELLTDAEKMFSLTLARPAPG